MSTNIKRSGIVVVLLGAIAMFGGVAGAAAEDGSFHIDPATNDGSKWRIAYYEGGPYSNYQQTLSATIKGLMKLGWIEPAELPAASPDETGDELWKWLADRALSDFVQFLPDAFYSAGWDDGVRRRLSNRIIERLVVARDVDVVIAMGTAAGLDLANDRHTTPMVVMSTSDPIGSGIIESVEDSGHDHVHASVDPSRHERQLTVFHEATGFERLGLAYENSSNGRSYAAMDVVERLSKLKGFDVVQCHTMSDVNDVDLAEQSVLNCLRTLAAQADAIYVTEQGGVTSRTLPQIVEIANDRRVPTFSQAGAPEVEKGLLMSLSSAGYRHIGEFNARTLAKIMNGNAPGDIGQLFVEPPKIAINLRTARAIGFNPPLMLLGAADEIYGEVDDQR